MIRKELISAYNATSIDDGHGELETYEAWLERQLLSRIEKLNKLEHPLPPAEGAEAFVKRLGLNVDYVKGIDLFLNPKYTVIDLMREFASQPQPTAEGAEEIIESIVESLGDPTYIHNHVFEIRPYTVEHKTEWWIFHKEVGSGEPLAQWLNKFATLHAQQMAEKMVEEKLKNAPKNCPKAAQCAHVEGGMKCPPNVICPI